MRIYIRLFTILERYGRDKIADDGSFEIAEGCNLGELVGQLGLPVKPAKVFLVNGHTENEVYVLKNADDVKILSFIGGG